MANIYIWSNKKVDYLILLRGNLQMGLFIL